VPGSRRYGWPHRRSLIALAVAVIVVGVTSAVLRHAVRPDLPGPPRPDRSAERLDRDALAAASVRRQVIAVERHSRSEFLGQYDRSPPTQRQAAVVFANLAAIPVTGFRARYLGDDPVNDVAVTRPGEWDGQIAVSWSMRGIAGSATSETVRYTFVRRGDRAYIVSIGSGRGERTPVWAIGALDVRRSSRTLVLGLDPGRDRRVAALLRVAVRDVTRVMTRWRGDLVAIVPRSTAEVAWLLGTGSGGYPGIAAVTSTQDGSRRSSSRPVIVVNPVQFDRLGPVGAHVVITHESTHVATRANASDLPLWLAEGFADYVGIGAARVPVRRAAGRIIGAVRANGPPAGLPPDAAFTAGRHGLEATYESAWLACRLIAATYGQDRLLAFYTAAGRQPGGARTAFRAVLNTTSARFTAEWRRHLRELADAG
jgi:hypothetical protein